MTRTPPLLLRLAGAAAAFVMLCGFQIFGPLDGGADGAPDHPDDPRWIEFRGVKVTADKAHGVLVAQFPRDLTSIAGKPLEIGGYIMPLEATTTTRHFILTRRSTGCPFCPPNEANEALEVFLTKPVHYEQRQFFVKGRLKLVPTSNQGLFFQLVDATAS
ncbi:MAG: DUF3299 domain-containing protein [Caulobacteraceae bacterium]|nr:DUF3299 domain-containing protein [Caulobacter sp.]